MLQLYLEAVACEYAESQPVRDEAARCSAWRVATGVGDVVAWFELSIWMYWWPRMQVCFECIDLEVP